MNAQEFLESYRERCRERWLAVAKEGGHSYDKSCIDALAELVAEVLEEARQPRAESEPPPTLPEPALPPEGEPAPFVGNSPLSAIPPTRHEQLQEAMRQDSEEDLERRRTEDLTDREL